MKPILFTIFSLSILLTSCADKAETNTSLSVSNSINVPSEIPQTIVDLTELHYNNKTSLWTLKDQLYSGYGQSYYPDSLPKEKIAILNGRKENQSLAWYPDGHLKQVANYHKGKLHGEKKKWSSDVNHGLVAELNYELGKAQGEQKQWYPTGELFKTLNMNMGREEGIQQGYRKNGALFANYEAKEGRNFGLKKATLCFGLDNENKDYEK